MDHCSFISDISFTKPIKIVCFNKSSRRLCPSSHTAKAKYRRGLYWKSCCVFRSSSKSTSHFFTDLILSLEIHLPRRKGWDPICQEGGVGIPFAKKEGLGSIYQEGRVGIPFTKREGLGSHLPRSKGWDPIYQEGRVGIPFTKKEGLGSHLPRRKGWDPIYQRKGWDPIYQEGRVGISFTDLNSPHVCVCPKSGTGFPTSYVFIVFSEFI